MPESSLTLNERKATYMIHIFTEIAKFVCTGILCFVLVVLAVAVS